MRYFLPAILFSLLAVGLLSLPAFCQGGKIVFASYRSGNGDIYLMNPDGSGLTNLTNAPEVESFPSWRADAGRIAFQRDNNVWTMAPNGSTPIQIATGNDYTDPDYSPDGSTIVFSKASDYDLYTVSADGSNVALLKSNQYGDYHPRWSPDGSKICFHTFTSDIVAQVFTVNPDGSGQVQLTSGAQSGNPDWSPDGNKIVYEVDSYDGTELYIMNADGTGQTRLTNNSKLDGLPTFSPDGTKIAFISNRDGNEEIYVMNANGSNQTRLTNNAARDTAPSWAVQTPANRLSVSVGDASVIERDSGTQNVTFTVTLSKPSTKTVTVTATPVNGMARAPGDFMARVAHLTFAPGQTVKTFDVPVAGDTLSEAAENFYVLLSEPVNVAIAKGRGTCAIADNDAPPSISVGDINVQEGHDGTRAAAFTLKLSAPSGQIVKVNYYTANGTAIANGQAPGGNDYVAVPPTQVAFPIGQTALLVRVPIDSDYVDEPNEDFLLNLSNPVNAAIVDNQAIATITDDDRLPSFFVCEASVSEGNSPQGTPGARTLTFTVSFNGQSAQPLSVNYATANGTAVAGSDYVATSGTLTFQPGENMKTFSVTINGDTTIERDELFYALLSNPTNAVIGLGRGTGTIINDDFPPPPPPGAQAPEASSGEDASK